MSLKPSPPTEIDFCKINAISIFLTKLLLIFLTQLSELALLQRWSKWKTGQIYMWVGGNFLNGTTFLGYSPPLFRVGRISWGGESPVTPGERVSSANMNRVVGRLIKTSSTIIYIFVDLTRDISSSIWRVSDVVWSTWKHITGKDRNLYCSF